MPTSITSTASKRIFRTSAVCLAAQRRPSEALCPNSKHPRMRTSPSHVHVTLTGETSHARPPHVIVVVTYLMGFDQSFPSENCADSRSCGEQNRGHCDRVGGTATEKGALRHELLRVNLSPCFKLTLKLHIVGHSYGANCSDAN